MRTVLPILIAYSRYPLFQDMSMTGGSIAESIALAASATSANGIGRVYTATSLPSHIWSFNGESSIAILPSAPALDL